MLLADLYYRRGITPAGILLLSKDRVILSAVPHHRTEADTTTGTLSIPILSKAMSALSLLFRNTCRILFILKVWLASASVTLFFGKLYQNILIHREYPNAFPVRLIIERGQVRTENSNKPHGFGTLNPVAFTPFPKNPVIAAFFREIHRADEFGSGMRNMMKYGKNRGGEAPEMIEGDVFRTIVKYSDSIVTPEVTGEVKKRTLRAISSHIGCSWKA